MTTETTDLALLDDYRLSDDDDFGLGLDPNKDLRLEFVQINGQMGFWTFGRDRQKGEKEFSAVLLHKLPSSRAYFKIGTLGDPLCSSDNGVLPVNAQQAADLKAGPTCATCQFGQWHDRIKPPCAENLNFLAAIPPTTDSSGARGEPFPFILRLRGTSIGVMQAFLTELERKRRIGGKRPAFALLCQFTSEQVRDAQKGQNYYKVVASIIGDSDRQDWPAYASMRTLYTERAQSLLTASAEAERLEAASETQATGQTVAERPITEPQVAFISALYAKLGIGPAEQAQLQNHIDLKELPRIAASELIGKLKDRELQQNAVIDTTATRVVDLNAGAVGEPEALPFLDRTDAAEASNATDAPDDEEDGEYIDPADMSEDDILDDMENPRMSREQLAQIMALAEAGHIIEAKLRTWCRQIMDGTDLDNLTSEQARAFADRIATRNANIAKSPAAAAVQKRLAGQRVVVTSKK